MKSKGHTFILLLQCKDRPGIVAGVSDFIFRQGGNIVSADQYSSDAYKGHFFMRVEFVIDKAGRDREHLSRGLKSVAGNFKAAYRIYDKARNLRMGIFVSRPGHCLADILYLYRAGELRVDVPFIASNFPGHQELAGQYGVPFYYIPATKRQRREGELLEIARDSDFLVLARYMLVLSPKFLRSYAGDIINIHHGFLPSFKGSNPYRQALGAGVKVIGSTAHFVNKELDAGPIIAQRVEEVSHRDHLRDLIIKGRSLEKRALSEALAKYIDYRIIRHGNKTIVF